MISFLTVICIVFSIFTPMQNIDGFKQKQLNYPRVREAFQQKEKHIVESLKSKKINSEYLEIFIRIFKSDRIIEVWAKNRTDQKFTYVCQYAFCASSGNLGPKRTQGDNQTPEGIYQIERFNPQSNFHLSLGINYPNKADKILCKNGNPGGDIFIHGNCVTIGCIPITDDKIKELYVLCVMAKNNGQSSIPVHIFPSRLNDKNSELLFEKYKKNQTLIQFWKELKPIFDYFEKELTIPQIQIGAIGNYIIKQ
jgi:murein L,D-transpeptidase YafK